MKISYFLDIPVGLGGAGNLLIRQAYLMSKLHDVVVVIPCDAEGTSNSEYVKRCISYGLDYISMYFETAYNFNKISFKNIQDISETIQNILVKERITLIHSVQLNPAVELAARILKIPHIMDIYSLREEEFQVCWCDIYAHYHLCDSQLFCEKWSRNLDIHSKCVRPIAIEEQIQRKSKTSQKNYNFLMLGALYTYKNQLTAIKAFEKCLEKYDMNLYIAGDDNTEYGKLCQQYILQHNLSERIQMVGFESDITELLKKSDGLICTSYNESFPSSIVEAITYDLTIISTPVAGVPEILINGYNAFISKDFSQKAIENSIEDCVLAYCNGHIFDIHRNAAETWLRNFEQNAVREQINAYYNEVIDKPYSNVQPFTYVLQEMKTTVSLLRDVYEEFPELERYGFYHTYIMKYLSRGKAYIWGAGKNGERAIKVLKALCPELEVIAVIDKKKTGQYFGANIIKPYEIVYDKDFFYIICFAQGKDEVIDLLGSKGLVLNKKVFVMP